MEIHSNLSPEDAEKLHQARLEHGAVDISISALSRALIHIQDERKYAFKARNVEEAISWSADEKNVIQALSGLGLAQPRD